MISIFKYLYFTNKTLQFLGVIIFLFILGQYFDSVFFVSKIVLFTFIFFVILDTFYLFKFKNAINAKRIIGDKLSNGDDNPIILEISNNYPNDIHIEIIDEIPYQFQMRDFFIETRIKRNETRAIKYNIHPTKRGEYTFGNLNIYSISSLGFIKRKFIIDESKSLAVYPSFLQMRKFAFLALSNRLSEFGIKKIRKVGQSLEFDHIRNYVRGDDYRHINWKASARKNELMLNSFQDERSQNIYSVIDLGKSMKMPFEGLTLLDYAINTSLVFSNIAVMKNDKAGLISFSQNVDSVLLADSKKIQIQKIQEILYKQETSFLESDFKKMVLTINHKVKQRSLIFLYTNFETSSNFKRYLKYLKTLASKHLLVVIFFENTELSDALEKDAKTLKDVYQKIVIEDLIHEKFEIMNQLNQIGIHSIYTKPKNLSVDTINKYLEIKNKHLL